jgi:hypothetical protein
MKMFKGAEQPTPFTFTSTSTSTTTANRIVSDCVFFVCVVVNVVVIGLLLGCRFAALSEL